MPVCADGIFLPQRISILVQRYWFVYVLKFIYVAPFFVPLAFEIEKPIFDTGIPQLQPLGESIVICIPSPKGRCWRSVVESPLRIRRCKRRRVWRRELCEKS